MKFLPDFLLRRKLHFIWFSVDSTKKEKYKTKRKYPLQPDTEKKLRRILEKEYEFYYFVRQRFYNLLQRVRNAKRKLHKIKKPSTY